MTELKTVRKGEEWKDRRPLSCETSATTEGNTDRMCQCGALDPPTVKDKLQRTGKETIGHTACTQLWDCPFVLVRSRAVFQGTQT